jgi:phosphoribosylanthranilate isomerase
MSSGVEEEVGRKDHGLLRKVLKEVAAC